MDTELRGIARSLIPIGLAANARPKSIAQSAPHNSRESGLVNPFRQFADFEPPLGGLLPPNSQPSYGGNRSACTASDCRVWETLAAWKCLGGCDLPCPAAHAHDPCRMGGLRGIRRLTLAEWYRRFRIRASRRAAPARACHDIDSLCQPDFCGRRFF
jgi:hypothetical protein